MLQLKEKVIDIQAGKDFSLLLTKEKNILGCGANA
jgi:alpha-tubulin suppressor-like RCC1 family protein